MLIVVANEVKILKFLFPEIFVFMFYYLLLVDRAAGRNSLLSGLRLDRFDVLVQARDTRRGGTEGSQADG